MSLTGGGGNFDKPISVLRPCDAEADEAEAIAGVAVHAIGGAAAHRAEEPRAAANAPQGAGVFAEWVVFGVGTIAFGKITAPLPGVAVHVEESPGIGLERAHG